MAMDTNIVTIDLGLRSYDIYIGTGLIYKFPDFVPEDVEGQKFFLVCDSNTQAYAEQIKAMLDDAKARSVELLILKPGEKTKSFAVLERVTDWFLGHKISRDSFVVAIGGGVIGDVTGFAASTIMRGVPYIQVPTSLLAQVDSSVGGKTGINTPRGKNLVGSFYQPSAVVIDIETLKTLPARELLAGYAEVLKYGLIGDVAFFSWLEQNGKDVCNLSEVALAHAIKTSTEAKAQTVEADEREQGQRALLNLGHTFGHALEAVAGYDGTLLHGEAVAIGMVMAFDLSVRLGICDSADLDRVTKHLENIGLPTRAAYIQPALSATAEELLEIMRLDKKVQNGQMRFIVVNGIGEAYVEDHVPEKLVLDVLRDSLGAEAVQKRRAEKDFKESFGVSRVRGLWKSVFSSHS